MKTINRLFLAIILIAAFPLFQQVAAQQKTKEEQEKELQILKAIDEQKKAMAEQNGSTAEADAAAEDQKAQMDDIMRDMDVSVNVSRSSEDAPRVPATRGTHRSYDFSEPFIINVPDVQTFYGRTTTGDSERTTWDLSKSVKENTFTKDYTFDVDKTATNVVMSVMGDCKTGEIRIKIVMPGGKSYSDIVIDEFGNLNWRKSFNISDTENQDKTGEWKFQVASTKATGFFKISLQTY